MTTKIRMKHGKEFKLQVVSAALGGVKTLAQVSSEFGVHVTQVKEWKKQALEAINERFSQRRGHKKQGQTNSGFNCSCSFHCPCYPHTHRRRNSNLRLNEKEGLRGNVQTLISPGRWFDFGEQFKT